MTTTAEPRGAHLLQAVLHVVSTDGLTAVSMRSVAARAAVSVAQVQYYFHTKANLISAAFDYANQGFLDSLDAMLLSGPSLSRLRGIVWAWLPLDAEREQRARIWLAYSATAATDTLLAETAAQLDTELRTWFAKELIGLKRIGQIKPDLDTTETAAQLLALIDGLTIQCLVLSIDKREDHARQALGAWLDRLAPQ